MYFFLMRKWPDVTSSRAVTIYIPDNWPQLSTWIKYGNDWSRTVIYYEYIFQISLCELEVPYPRAYTNKSAAIDNIGLAFFFGGVSF
jgi:hypothetical protein